MKAISLGLSLLAIACSSVSAAEKPTQAAARKPNLIWIMADDKYESAGPKAENLRENRQNARFFARIQIAGNYGKFR